MALVTILERVGRVVSLSFLISTSEKYLVKSLSMEATTPTTYYYLIFFMLVSIPIIMVFLSIPVGVSTYQILLPSLEAICRAIFEATLIPFFWRDLGLTC